MPILLVKLCGLCVRSMWRRFCRAWFALPLFVCYVSRIVSFVISFRDPRRCASMHKLLFISLFRVRLWQLLFCSITLRSTLFCLHILQFTTAVVLFIPLSLFHFVLSVFLFFGFLPVLIFACLLLSVVFFFLSLSLSLIHYPVRCLLSILFQSNPSSSY